MVSLSSAWLAVSSIATFLLASMAAWIAYQQMQIANRKLNSDLFDRRFAVYTATQRYFVACLNHAGGSQQDQGEFYDAIQTAPFIFDSSTTAFLSEVMKASVTMQVFGKHLSNYEHPDHQNLMDQYHKAQTWMADEYGNLTLRFQCQMSLASIRPFAVGDVSSRIGLQSLKTRLSGSIRLATVDGSKKD